MIVVVSPAVVRAFRHAAEAEADRLHTLPADEAGDIAWRATEAGIREALAQHFREMLDALAEPATPPSRNPVLDAVLAELGPVTEEATA